MVSLEGMEEEETLDSLTEEKSDNETSGGDGDDHDGNLLPDGNENSNPPTTHHGWLRQRTGVETKCLLPFPLSYDPSFSNPAASFCRFNSTAHPVTAPRIMSFVYYNG